jgi:hypothetical protein
MRARSLLVMLLLGNGAIGATSCKRSSGNASADSTFVHAMVDLRLVTANTTLDSAGKARARDSVMRHYSTSPEDLDRSARRLGADPDRAVALLRKIDNGARLAATRPAPLPTTPPAPAPQATTHR